MDNIMWTIIEVIFSSINVVLIYLFLRIFLKNRNRPISPLIAFSILAITAIKFYASYYLNDNTVLFSSISLATIFILGMILFRVKPKDVILPVIFAFICGVSSEVIAVFLITGIQSVSVEDIMHLSIYRLQFRILSYLIYLVFIILVNRFVGMRFDFNKAKPTISLCILPLFSMLIVYQFAVNVTMTMYEPTIREIIPLVSVITVNIFIFIIIDGLLKQKEKEQAMLLIKSQIEANQRHIKHLISTHEQIRKMSHDFKHSVSTLCTLCEEKEYDVLLSNLHSLSDKSHSHQLIDSKNIILDALLTSKKDEAENMGIDFELKLDVQPHLSYISLEHSVLLSNGIDNAVEACYRSKGKSMFIKLELTANLTAFMFRIKNTLGEKPEPNDTGEFFKTKKSDKLHHGIGLRSMMQTCKELGGDLKCDYNEEHFMIWVYVPISVRA